MKYILEFTDADDIRQKDGWCDPLQSDTLIPVPLTGDEILIDGKRLKVDRRLYAFSDSAVHVQLFCRKMK